MFHCADLLHIAHLKSKSYAEHVALGDAYDSIRDAADDICELIQGYCGLLDIKIAESSYAEPIAYLKAERTEYTSKLSEYSGMMDVQNKLQDLLAVFSKTIYKLENLK